MNYKKIFKPKSYCHLDRKISPSTRVLSYVSNPDNIKSHSFLPFIYFPIEERKYDQNGPKETKIRDIYYSSHLDRYVYQYYAYTLSKYYEALINTEKYSHLDDSVIAYRKLGKNNIHFAKKAFEFIKKQKSGTVYCIDISKFFDNLDHRILKENLKLITGLPTLPADLYKVYRSLIKYSWVSRDDIKSVLKLTEKQIRRIDRFCNPDEFRKKIKAAGYLKTYSGDKGIPQGSSMSALLSNIYMIEFDRLILNYMTYYNGMYLRYSDDIFITVPFKDKSGSIEKLLQDLISKVKLPISEKKTEITIIENGVPEAHKKIQYLGFTYSESGVAIRDRTITKYYNKLYTRLKIVKRKKSGKKPKNFRRKLFLRYTHLGRVNRKNFLNYAYRASEILENPEIKKKIDRHWKKVEKYLK